jgi:3-methyladenine DNA glycosylase AlkD
MRHVIPFRGVGIPQIRERLAVWRESTGVANWSPADQLDLALEFFAHPIAEDKLAGILFLQNYLYDQFPWSELLPRYAALFQSGQIFDWNICDWFCVRVLGPTISLYGMDCAATITDWQTAENLWQARASVVAFVPVTDQTQYYPLIFKACATLLLREERFAKTAVGWILRDMAGHDKSAVTTFID